MPHVITFAGGESGAWRVTAMQQVFGPVLEPVTQLNITQSSERPPQPATGWALQGLISNLRYAERGEVVQLRNRQEGLGRQHARCAALIPIKKSQAWWDLAQDERRAIFETRSHHTAVGLDYLPAIARQLYHARDLGEPFDFLTWFEFAPEHASAFDDLLARLRATEEWRYVEREVEIRLERAG
jgi:Chlorite dismutase